MAKRDAGDQPPATLASAMGRRHGGLGPSLVDEDQAARIEFPALVQPSRPSGLNIGTIQLGCGYCFFLRVIPSRAKKRRIEPYPITIARSAKAWRSPSIVMSG